MQVNKGCLLLLPLSGLTAGPCSCGPPCRTPRLAASCRSGLPPALASPSSAQGNTHQLLVSTGQSRELQLLHAHGSCCCTCMPSRAKLMPRAGSGSSGGTSSAGRSTAQVPSACPYKQRFSRSGSHSRKKRSTLQQGERAVSVRCWCRRILCYPHAPGASPFTHSLVRARRMPFRRPAYSSYTVCGVRILLRGLVQTGNNNGFEPSPCVHSQRCRSCFSCRSVVQCLLASLGSCVHMPSLASRPAGLDLRTFSHDELHQERLQANAVSRTHCWHAQTYSEEPAV